MSGYYTAGPWNVGSSLGGVVLVGGPFGDPLATVTGPNADADARLIAAAPDLLEAARALVDAPHVLQVRADGWGLQHPLTCRPALTECEFHKSAMELSQRPVPDDGEYVVELLGGAVLNLVEYYVGPDPALALIDAVRRAA